MMLSLIVLASLTTTPSPNDAVQSDNRVEQVTVEATKQPASRSETTGTLSLIDSDSIEQELAQTIQDLVRYEPGVDVVNQGSRFGLSGISIRGIGGNRVKLEVDGIATSDAFSIGSFANASRDFVDVDSLKQVEIVRGPGSALFGSDALGGVVSFVTKSPSDVLGDDDNYIDTSLGYNSVDASQQIRATAATRHGALAAMFRATVRQGEERIDAAADPLDDQSISALVRVEYGVPGAGAVNVTLEHFSADSDTEVDSREGLQDFTAGFGFPFVIETTQVTANDTRERNRLSVGQEWTTGVLGNDYLRWRAYTQNSSTEQRTFEARESRINGVTESVTRDRSFLFEQELEGFELNAAKDLEFGSFSHTLSYGLEFEQTRTEQLRNGLEFNLQSGDISNQVGPDLFPVRDFPKSKTRRTGVYLADRMSWGKFTLVPGLRWDRYELTPQNDPIFIADNPGIATLPLNDEQLSPKLGVLWDFHDRWTVFAQYSEGFRAPPVNDVNVGFTNFQFGYTALPNPDLASESSRGAEVGVRYASADHSFEATVFKTDYDDFIESFQVVGFDPINQLLQFQSINVDAVEIEGGEFKGRFSLPYLDGQLHLVTSAAYANGHNTSTGVPLRSIAPFNGVVGLEFDSHDSRWGTSVVARGAVQQDDLDNSDDELLSPPGYVVFDAFGYWKPAHNIRLRAGVYNVADKQYTSYLDVQGVPANSLNASRLRRPGVNVSLAFDWTF